MRVERELLVFLIFIIPEGLIVQGALTQWRGIVRLRFASLTMTVFFTGDHAGARSRWMTAFRAVSSCVTPRSECAMILLFSGRKTMEHASNTFQTFEDLEVYQGVL